jgi:hypothetical protein
MMDMHTAARIHLISLISEPLNRIYIVSVVSDKNVTKVVWYILVPLSFFNNTVSMVSGVSFLRTEVRRQPATSSHWHARGLSLSKAAESKTDCKKLEEKAFNLNSFLCHLFTDT